MTNYDVIDQFFAAQIAANENETTLKALRPQVEEAVQRLIADRGLPRTFTGTIDYHGFKIVVSRPKSYTWEKNTNPAIISDPNHAIYLQQLALQEQIAAQLKDMRADVKRSAEKLAMKELLCPGFLVGRILYPMEFANPQKSRTFAPKLNDYGNGNKCYNTNSNFLTRFLFV